MSVSVYPPGIEATLKDVVSEFAGDVPSQPQPHVLSKRNAARKEAAASAVRAVCGPLHMHGHNRGLLQTGYVQQNRLKKQTSCFFFFLR